MLSDNQKIIELAASQLVDILLCQIHYNKKKAINKKIEPTAGKHEGSITREGEPLRSHPLHLYPHGITSRHA